MPAASTKPENKASQEATDPMKQVLLVVDKKVRNLEKRKGKLDVYKEKEESGTELEKDQKAAVEKYGEVVQNLEFARELQKQFTAISADAEKILKKQAKREKAVQQNFELKRIKEMLQLQNLLDNLGSEKVRGDFQTGKHGAVVLTEENLNQLDELYKLISPSRDAETDYQEQLNAASEHIVSLIDAKDKEVLGTTYKELKELIDLINQCGYFENAPLEEEEEETAATTEEDYSVNNAIETTEAKTQEPFEQHQQQMEQQFGNSIASHETTHEDMTSIAANADSYFSKTAQQQHEQQVEDPNEDPAYSRQRPFQEIVSSVQGNFNFLQESTIDMESPHMDPAVVAAHPMPPAPLGRPTPTHSADSSTLSQQAYSSQGFGDLQQKQQSLSDPSQSQNDTQSRLNHQQQTVSALTGQDYSSQTFTQNSLSQSLQNDSLFQSSSVKDNSSSQMSSMVGQTVNDTTISQFELPPSIPMPPGHDTTQENQSSDSQPEKKQFTMNPNAGVFQSQIYPQTVDNQQQNDFGSQSDYQNDNYQSGGFQRRGGGFRGGRGRGGSSDRGHMNGGFSGNRGGNRGGYNDRRGGFQGYPPRNDYRPEGGYQGQNYNGNYNSGFQKRGGSTRGNNPRGGSGAPRGGPPRGSSRGRGGPSGGFGRPANQQQQVA